MPQGGGQPASTRPEMDISKTKEPVAESVKPTKGMTPVGKEVQTPAKIQAEQPKMEQVEEKKPPLAAVAASVPKPNIADVQKPTRPTVGLAGELSYSLADFRRISPNPADRIKKIENQLGVLEEDNYPTRLKGLAAWRQSEVMKMYLESGKKSLEDGTQLPQQLGSGGPDTLSWEEWQAISELNERIRHS